MVSQQAQLGFLKELILQSNQEESRMLLRRLSQVEAEEQASRRWTLRIASGIASLYAVMALATQGWGWLWRHAERPLGDALLWVLGMAVFSLLLVGGCWLWHRSALKRLIGDTQRFVAGWLASDPLGSAETSRQGGEEAWKGRRCRQRPHGEWLGWERRRRSSTRERR
jgi:hypothetical protein